MRKRTRTEKRKVIIDNSIDFIFSDKAGYDENFFAYCHTPSVIKNPLITYTPLDDEIVIKKVLKDAMSRAFKLDSKEVFIATADHTSEPTVTWFGASYCHDSGTLDVRVIKPKLSDLDADEGWRVFNEFASFKEILDSIEPLQTDEAYVSLMNYSKNKKPKILLELVRDYPVWLSDKEILIDFIDILKTARWGKEKKVRNEAVSQLKESLIPKFPGGEVPFPPGCELSSELLKKLAAHLSKKCKEAVDLNLGRKRGERLNEYDYELLISWARKEEDFRISTLTRLALSELIFKPVEFARDLLLLHFNGSSSTFRRKIK